MKLTKAQQEALKAAEDAHRMRLLKQKTVTAREVRRARKHKPPLRSASPSSGDQREKPGWFW